MSSTHDSSNRAKRQVFLGSEIRMHRDTKSQVRGSHNAAAYAKWGPYVDAFESVNIVARFDRDQESDTGVLVEGPGVRVVPLPNYFGPSGMIKRALMVWRAISRLGASDSIFIGRLPEPVSLLLFVRAKVLRSQFISLVVSDPMQLGRAAFPGPTGVVAGTVLRTITKYCVQRSTAVIYVTQHWLQSIYRARDKTLTLAKSNVALSEESFVRAAREYATALFPRVNLVSIGEMGSRIKGFDTLANALHRLKLSGVNAQLVIVGGGLHLDRVRSLAARKNVLDLVQFIGHVSDVNEIRKILDSADLYVSASRAEGLSRAIVEAMARGLPVVATRAGGTSELLDEEFLVGIDRPEEMAARILNVINDPDALSRMSEENIAMARRICRLASNERMVTFLKSVESRAVE